MRASFSVLAPLLFALGACSSPDDTGKPDGRGGTGANGGGGGSTASGGNAAMGGSLSAGGGMSGGSTASGGNATTGGNGGSAAGPGGTSGETGGTSGDGAATGGTTGSGGAAACTKDVWSTLEACGWPGSENTGPDLTQCPGGKLTDMGGASMPTLRVDGDGDVIECANVRGTLRVTGKNVVVRNSRVAYDSGKKGEAANATAAIFVEDGASITVDQVEIDGLDGAHACIWHQGTSMVARHVNCHGVDDGIFTWASSGTAGDGFTVEDSYFHDLTPLTANGHMDGFQTEGGKNGVIRHNTYDMSADATSAVAIWNSLKSSSDILVERNLMAGGGATVYAEDYDPSEASPQGGFSVTNVRFENNTFSTRVSKCVGKYFVWYSRPQYLYGGGPTDGWKRSGNVVLETGENVDAGNPHVDGQPCR